MVNLRLLCAGYLIVIVGLFLYSFTQVDLSLTLSEWSIWQLVQKYFQHVGYFQRPLSTALYIAIILLLFLFYLVFLRLARIGEIRGIREIWGLIIATTVILTFSYNAFSYDLFNYMFDAKIVSYYHQNPYAHKALDYAGDPMLSFMHWTHRTYPYGPVWLILTVPLSIGINFFLPTFFLFKALASISFLGTAFFIGKILRKITPQNETSGLVFFALNPLVLIESLVSGHNDITMIFFAMVALYYLIGRQYHFSLILLFISIGIKFATIFILPLFLVVWFLKEVKRKAIKWNKVFLWLSIAMIIPIIFSSARTELQPWYFLVLFPFVALIAEKRIGAVLTFFVSVAMLVPYIQYLLLGEWSRDIVDLKIKLLIYSIVIAIFVSVFSSKRILSAIKNRLA